MIEVTLTDGLMIAAVFIAPIVAVQVQKWLERFREEREQRMKIFKILMSTRATILSQDHVMALNMIDLEFHGTKYKAVREAWREYFDHLNEKLSNPDDKTAQNNWEESGRALLAKLLKAMGGALGYDFDIVHLKRSVYSPVAHNIKEMEDAAIRRQMLRVLSGENPLRLDVTSLPYDADASRRQEHLQELLARILSGEVELPVRCRTTTDDLPKKKIARLGDTP